MEAHETIARDVEETEIQMFSILNVIRFNEHEL